MIKGNEIVIAPTGETMLFYSHDKEKDRERGCIGHLRADFGSDGDEFWTSWDDHCEDLKTQAFKDELDEVINHLRKKENMLNSLRALTRYCYQHTEAQFKADHHKNTYGFKIETEAHSYYLRCNILQGDYNLYCYCYQRDRLELCLAAAHAEQQHNVEE